MSNHSRLLMGTSSIIGGKKMGSRSFTGRAIIAFSIALGMFLISLSTILILPPIPSKADAAETYVYFYEGISVNSVSTSYLWRQSDTGYSPYRLQVLRWGNHDAWHPTSEQSDYCLRILPRQQLSCVGNTVINFTLKSYGAAYGVDTFFTGKNSLDPLCYVVLDDGTQIAASSWFAEPSVEDNLVHCSITFPGVSGRTVNEIQMNVVCCITAEQNYSGSVEPTLNSPSSWVAAEPLNWGLFSWDVLANAPIDLGPVVSGLDEVGNKVEQIGEQISGKVEELGDRIEDVLDPEHDFSPVTVVLDEQDQAQQQILDLVDVDGATQRIDDLVSGVMDIGGNGYSQQLGGVMHLVSESAKILTDRPQIKSFLQWLIILGAVGLVLGLGTSFSKKS